MALDFPSNPSNGQVYDNFIYDAAKGTWKSLSSGASPNYLVNPTITNAVITATADTPSTIPLTVNGAASQSANLQEWKNSAGITLSSINNLGQLTTDKVSNTGFDFTLGSGDQISRGNSGASRALVKINNSKLFINYASDFTGGTVIDSSLSVTGKLSTPSQPAFRAYNVSGASGAILSFATSDTAFNGRNAGWNGSRFTAPIAGVYIFSFAILIGAGTNARILFRINGTYSTTYGDTLESNYSSYTYTGMSMAFFLNVNDYVELYNEQTAVYGSSFGSFSGFYVG